MMKSNKMKSLNIHFAFRKHKNNFHMIVVEARLLAIFSRSIAVGQLEGKV